MRHASRTCQIGLLFALSFALPVASADDVRERIAAAGTAKEHDADAVVVLEWTDVLVRPSGIGTERTHRVVKVLRPPAIRELAVQRFPFDPHTNRLELIAVRVYRADGTVEDVPLADTPKQPQTGGGIFWPSDQYLVGVPRLKVGDAVETISAMTGFNVAYLGGSADAAAQAAPPADGVERNAYGAPLEPPVPGHWHNEVHFWTTRYPVLEKRYTVRVPKDKPLQIEVYNGELRPALTFDDEHLIYTFEKKGLEPLRGESRMEPWPNVATKLLLATLPTWEDKARWLHEVSEPMFAADDAIRGKVAEIIADCDTPEEKYTALNHWVAENIRYAGTSRGMCEGYTIHPSVETFRDRCGVCKDKAGMLVTMLRVAGFESYLVMTMARQRVDRIPADQFNHAVTCIRNEDGSLTLLDPTWMPKSRDNWSTLEPLQHVVYGLPEGKELSQSPYFPPESCRATWKSTARLTEGQGLAGAVAFEAVGAPEGRVRRSLAALHPTRQQELYDESFRSLAPNAAVRVLEAVDAVDFSRPLAVRCAYEADGYAVGDGDVRVFRLPMMQTPFGDRVLYDLFGHTDTDERDYGLALLATRLVEIDETIELPPGWSVAELPKPAEIDGPAASLRFEIEEDGNRIQYTCRLAVKSWTIPPEEFASYKEAIEKFEEIAEFEVICAKASDDAAGQR